MTARRTCRALVVLALLVAGAACRGQPGGEPVAGPGAATVSAPGDDALEAPDSAERVSVETLLAAGDAVADPGPVDTPPVYVGDVTVDEAAGRVDFDLVVAFRPRVELSFVPLYLTALLPAVRDTGVRAEVEGTRDGEPVHVGKRFAAGLALVQLDPPVPAGEPVRVRLRGGYDVPDAQALADAAAALDDDGFGRPPLLAASDGTLLLAGWLPTLSFAEDGTTSPPPGRAPRSPPGTWSLRLRTGATVLTGGDEGPCVDGEDGCIRVRASGLTTLDAVATGALPSVDRSVGALHLHLLAPRDRADAGTEVVGLAADAAETFTAAFGELPWRQVDLVPATVLPLSIAGVSFPGMVVLEGGAYAHGGDAASRQLVAHEVAHQWFGALVDSDTPDGAVVHESIAQYLSYLELAEHAGEDVATGFAASLRDFHREVAGAAGDLEEPPADPSFDVATDVRGALIYGRAALAWVEAEQQLGRDAVVDFLASLVDEHRSGYVSATQVRDAATAWDDALGEVLTRYWFTYGEI